MIKTASWLSKIIYFQHCQKKRDEATGLYFYRARYYDAIVGRFIGEDAIVFTAGDANLYRYVVNSPINLVDPMGMQVVAPPPPVIPVPVPPTAPPPGPWYAPLLKKVPWVAPLVIPGGLLNPLPTSNGELPHKIPKPNECPNPENQRRRKRCEFIWESPPTPNSAFRTCAYNCRGYGGPATFPWPKDLPCPDSFDDLFPKIPPGYPDPNIPGT
jgi:RHS repeat-associated protein